MVVQLPARLLSDVEPASRHRGCRGVARRLRERRGYGYLTSPSELMPVPEDVVRATVSGAGCTMLDISSDEKAGDEWLSLRYCAQRPITAVHHLDGWEFPALHPPQERP